MGQVRTVRRILFDLTQGIVHDQRVLGPRRVLKGVFDADAVCRLVVEIATLRARLRRDQSYPAIA